MNNCNNCNTGDCDCNCKKSNIVLDVAVLTQEYSPVEVTCNNNHIVNLDEIEITEENFKNIFYPYGENFGLDCNRCNNMKDFFYITFLAPYRKIDGKLFSLLEEIIKNIEDDLNVSRNCFTTCSLIELTNDLSNIKTLCDINCCSLLCCLTWSNVLSVLKDYNLANNTNIIYKPLFVVNVVFKTPNPNVKPTIIKFNYRLSSIFLPNKI